MFLKPVPFAVLWNQAIVSPEEIHALLHGLWPLSPDPAIKNQIESGGVEGISWPGSDELRQRSSKISV